ncbi:hypothetical protein [Vibrio hangzhouensis]|uniref:Uncharacterized protein n=1 Tax=Vibrio hangzhouensis TaxID=462991 RepID=A0A1H5YCB5_9VIBR|nr:hypothetical protein [Vibrio hangzhouensis]SEG21638.1 hypothetical protein SAMN04488244_10912 [Vibrio hangzhouensis]
MASKNPIKGYLRCHMPDCHHVASVHAVGEHRIMQDGQPPKNKRNTGRLYYNCPSCGFQQGKGQAFQDWITNYMKPNKTDFETLPDETVETEAKPVPKPLIQTVFEPDLTELESEIQPKEAISQRTITYLLGAVGLITFIYLLLKTGSKTNEQRARS